MKNITLFVSLILAGFSFSQELEKKEQTKIQKPSNVKVDRTIKASSIKAGHYKKASQVKAVQKPSVKVEAKEEK